MGVKLTNWNGVGLMFEYTIPERIDRSIEDAIDQVKEVYTDSVYDLIMEQPGEWTPKTDEWASRSGSDRLFIGENRKFLANVALPARNSRGIRAKRGNKKVFVGARYDLRHPSGFSMADLAEILQSTPDFSRDLFGMAYDRVEDKITRIWNRVGYEVERG